MKKLVCLLLAAVMVLTGMLSGGNILKAAAQGANTQKLLDLNFEDGSTEGWVPHSDSVWNAQEYNKFGVTTDYKDAANHVLELCHYSKDANYQVQHKLLAAASTAVLEYRLYLYAWSSTHRSYLPGLLYEGVEDKVNNVGSAPFSLYVQDTDGYDGDGATLFYNYGRGIDGDRDELAYLKYGQWYTVRVEYDLPNKTVAVYLDGNKLALPTEEITSTNVIIDKDAKLDRVSLGTSTYAHTWSCYDDIVVTTQESVTPLDTSTYFVAVEGNGAHIAKGYAAVGTKGQDYTLTVTPVPGHTYTVTATVDGTPAEVAKEGNTYTVAAVSGKLVYTIDSSVNTDKVSVHRYMTLQGTNMWLVLQGEELGDTHRATYGGVPMFYSPAYKAYAYLVVVDELTTDAAKAQMAVEAGKAATVDYSADTNMSGKADINDAQYVYNMYNVAYPGITETETVKRYLLADVNADKCVSVKDALAVCEGVRNADPNALRTEGKVCATFGDSITWYDGQVYNTGKEQGKKAYGYQQYMLSELHFSSLINYGYSGAPMPYIVENIMKQITDAHTWQDIDFITIMSGANDERLGTPVGTVAPKGSDFDTTTYIGALQSGIEYALSMNPDIHIMLFTPIKGWIYAPLGYGFNNPNPKEGIVTDKWEKAVKEVAKLYDLPVCDLYNDSGIDYKIEHRQLYMNDPEPPENQYYSLHPSTAGYKLMGDAIVKSYKELW